MPHAHPISAAPARVTRRRRTALTALLAATGLAALAAPALSAPTGWGPQERIGGATDTSVETPLAAMNAADDAIVAWASPQRLPSGRFRDLVEVRTRVGQRGAWSTSVGLGTGIVAGVAIHREHGGLVITVDGRGMAYGSRGTGGGKWTTARIGYLGGEPARVRAATILDDGTALAVLESRSVDFGNPDDASFSSVTVYVQPRPAARWVRLREALAIPSRGLDAAAVNAAGDVLLLADFAGKGQASLTEQSASRWRPWVEIPEWAPVAPAGLPAGTNPSPFLPAVSDLSLGEGRRSSFALSVWTTPTTRETRVLASLAPDEWAKRLTLPGQIGLATSRTGHLIAGGLGLGAAPGRASVGVSPGFLPHSTTGQLIADPIATLADAAEGGDGAPIRPVRLAVTDSGRAVALWHTETGPGPDGIAGSAAVGAGWEPATPLGSSRDTTQLVAGGRSALALIDESEEGGGLLVRRHDLLPRAEKVTFRRERGRLILRFTLSRRASMTGTISSPALGRPITISAKSLAAGRRRIDLGRRPAGGYRLRMSLCVADEGCAPVRRIQNAR